MYYSTHRRPVQHGKRIEPTEWQNNQSFAAATTIADDDDDGGGDGVNARARVLMTIIVSSKYDTSCGVRAWIASIHLTSEEERHDTKWNRRGKQQFNWKV